MITYSLTMSSPIGLLRLSSDEKHLVSVSFDAETTENSDSPPEILIQSQKQLEEYFSGTRQQFDLKVAPDGTEFQHRVWGQVSDVNYGNTKSYVEIAISLGSENYSRAVGMANGKNPIPIIIPCHRVIGHNGKLTGYAGGLERKKWLLLHEQQISGHGRLF